MSDTLEIESKPRLLCSAFAYIPGPVGITSRLLERLPQLVLDFDIDVICLRNEGQAHIEKYAGCKIYRVSAPDSDIISQAHVFRRAIKRLLEGGDYDIVHFTDPFAGAELLDSKADYNFRTVFEVASLPSWELRETPWVFGKYPPSRVIETIKKDERRCLKETDIILAATEVTRKLLLKRGAKAETAFKIAGGGILGQFAVNVEKASPPIILLISRHAPWYDFSALLDSVEALRQKKLDFRVLIVGPQDPNITPKIKRGLERRGLSGIVEIEPLVSYDEVPPLLQTATIGLIPLRAYKQALEGGIVPRKFYEYLAAALPIVAADTPAMREVSDNGAAVVLYKLSDAKDLADKLARLLKNEKVRNDYAYKSLKLYKNCYHPDISAAILKRVYNALIKRKPIVAKMFELPSQKASVVLKDGDKVFAELPSFEELAEDDVTRDLIHEEEIASQVSKKLYVDGATLEELSETPLPTDSPEERTPDVTRPVVAKFESVDTEVTPITPRKDEKDLPVLEISTPLAEADKSENKAYDPMEGYDGHQKEKVEEAGENNKEAEEKIIPPKAKIETKTRHAEPPRVEQFPLPSEVGEEETPIPERAPAIAEEETEEKMPEATDEAVEHPPAVVHGVVEHGPSDPKGKISKKVMIDDSMLMQLSAVSDKSGALHDTTTSQRPMPEGDSETQRTPLFGGDEETQPFADLGKISKRKDKKKKRS